MPLLHDCINHVSRPHVYIVNSGTLVFAVKDFGTHFFAVKDFGTLRTSSTLYFAVKDFGTLRTSATLFFLQRGLRDTFFCCQGLRHFFFAKRTSGHFFLLSRTSGQPFDFDEAVTIMPFSSHVTMHFVWVCMPNNLIN